MRRWLLVSMALLILGAAVVAFANKAPVKPETVNKLAFSVPKGWKAGRTGTNGKTLIMMAGSPQPLASVVVLSVAERNLKLDKWYSQNKANLPKAVPGLKVVAEGTTRIAGQPARTIEFTSVAKLTKEKWHTKQVYVIKGTTGCAITFATSEAYFKKFLGDFSRILASAKWTK
jgi:hypothetical protein